MEAVMAINAKQFDALAYVKKAKELGTSEELAEFQARQIEQAFAAAISTIEKRELATKTDIAMVRAELRESELRLKNELIKWILGTGVATILAMAGILRLMSH
jgi:membrane-bound ClpP family serine protease